LILYVATIAALLWWYEIRPAWMGSRQLQGTWREIEGVMPNERLGESYFHVNDDETWFVYPRNGKWDVQRSRIAIRPADHFFVVRRAFGFDYGNTRETEYVVFLKNNELYVLRGLSPFDPVTECTIEKRSRVDSMPGDAAESIQAYLNRIAPAPSDEQAPAVENN
jgi:hypothetical protein